MGQWFFVCFVFTLHRCFVQCVPMVQVWVCELIITPSWCLWMISVLHAWTAYVVFHMTGHNTGLGVLT